MGTTGTERVFRIAHGWLVRASKQTASSTLISRFLRPAVQAIPPGMAHQFGGCCIRVVDHLDPPSAASRWSSQGTRLEVSLATIGRESHDIALELLVCLGQALWETLSASRRNAYWLLLDREIVSGITGEIDEEALKRKILLLSNRYSAASRRRLESYGSASFAGTAAEYVHSLWHDVSVRTGPRFLPGKQLRARLELLSRWYPPGRGHPLFPLPSPKPRG